MRARQAKSPDRRARREQSPDSRPRHSASPDMRTRHLLHAAAIILVACVAYAASIHGQWISDDVTSIAQNPVLRSLAPGNLRLIMSRFEGPNYAPFYVLSLAIDWAMFGNDPVGFHVVNLLIHIADALLV